VALGVLRFILSRRFTVPKIKTHKSTAKRFRRTAGGLLVRRHQGRGHLRRNKAPRTLIKYRQIESVDSKAADKRVTQLAPYID
jgi:large subunit ribosomal protein L35